MFSKNTRIKFNENPSFGAEFFHTDGRTWRSYNSLFAILRTRLKIGSISLYPPVHLSSPLVNAFDFFLFIVTPFIRAWRGAHWVLQNTVNSFLTDCWELLAQPSWSWTLNSVIPTLWIIKGRSQGVTPQVVYYCWVVQSLGSGYVEKQRVRALLRAVNISRLLNSLCSTSTQSRQLEAASFYLA